MVRKPFLGGGYVSQEHRPGVLDLTRRAESHTRTHTHMYTHTRPTASRACMASANAFSSDVRAHAHHTPSWGFRLSNKRNTGALVRARQQWLGAVKPHARSTRARYVGHGT